MSYSRSLGIANGLVIGAGLYGNAVDMAKTCNVSGWFEEKCNRSILTNTTSGSLNIIGGVTVGYALGLVPVTGGLSIALIAGGSFIWGLYGSELVEKASGKLEEFIFD